MCEKTSVTNSRLFPEPMKLPPAAHIASRGARVHLRPALAAMAPTMAQRDWERRARSKHRAGGSHASPWHHPHATWLTLIVVAVVLLQGVLYGRVHARSMRIQTADDEIARRAEAIRSMLVKQEDLREQVASLREVVVRMDTAVVDTLEKGAAAKRHSEGANRAEPTKTDAGSSVKSLREQQRILMDRASLANRLAGIAPTDADEAFFDANDAALQEIREERAAYGRREQMETAGGALVWSNSVKDAMATGAKVTWDDEDRVAKRVTGTNPRRAGPEPPNADDDGTFATEPKSLFASYLGRYGAGGSFLTPSASKAGERVDNGDMGILKDSALGRMGASRLDKARAGDNPHAYAAVVIMSCNRADYLERTVESVRAALGMSKQSGDLRSKFPVFISQDGRNKAVRTYAESRVKDFHWMQHIEDAPPQTRTRFRWDSAAYYRISAHYKWAMKTLFEDMGYERVIVLEDDMELSPDFFGYFEAAGRLMDADPSVYTVSSWNDNGQKIHVSDETRLYRSDFFPGLGWMLNKQLWHELAPKWPDSYWDDWMRLSDTRKGRESIRPEVCRTFNFGEAGSSKGQFYRTYLASIKRATRVDIEWSAADLTYLDGKTYEDSVRRSLESAAIVDSPTKVHLASKDAADSNVYKVVYNSEREFNVLAKRFGVFAEWKDGVPRAGYRGIVTFKMYQGRATVMLVPAPKAQVARTYAQWNGEQEVEVTLPAAKLPVQLPVQAKAVEKEAAPKVDAGADDGLTEEERNDRLTQAMERWWQYEAGA